MANETCLDARTVQNEIGAFTVVIDERGWHDDNRKDTYGQHFTFRIVQHEQTVDTCHVYERGGTNCYLTVCGRNYGGHGVPNDGYYWYLNDTNPQTT